MSENGFTLEIYNSIGSFTERYKALLYLTLTRERYTPFVTLDYSFLADFDSRVSTADICSVRLFYGGERIFLGRSSDIRLTKTAGGYILSGRAVSYTKTVSTSDAVPGMMFDCTLSSLVSANTAMPNVSYQQVSESASYIFVKESDTIWSAIAALSIKLFDNYPYIVGENTVNIKKTGQASFDYSSDVISDTFYGSSLKNAVSKIYMQGTQGTYDYSFADSEAIRRGVIRERYIPLDRQWLSDPERGLKHKMLFARRGGIFRGFTYKGFKNEQLCDNVAFSLGSVHYTGEVSKLTVKADKRGIFTTITSYHDGYSKIV
ncbi:MAG: hypothetical protein J6O40_04905 [Ruminococcus sp.]|nr:hypothetical protein [Ruminococcus sp.]